MKDAETCSAHIVSNQRWQITVVNVESTENWEVCHPERGQLEMFTYCMRLADRSVKLLNLQKS